MTNEVDSLITPMLESADIRFPVARVSGNFADEAYGVRGFPSMVLIAADGSVASSGYIVDLHSQVAELLKQVPHTTR